MFLFVICRIADPVNLVVHDSNNNDRQESDREEDIEDYEDRMSCDGSVDGDCPHGGMGWIEPKTIECGDVVLSLAFGSSLPHKKLRNSNVKYRMYDHSNTNLMLAIGLKSGKIKTYDIGKGKFVSNFSSVKLYQVDELSKKSSRMRKPMQ